MKCRLLLRAWWVSRLSLFSLLRLSAGGRWARFLRLRFGVANRLRPRLWFGSGL